MTGPQTDHDRARIIEAHDTRAQELYWGDDDEEPEADYYERNRQDEIDDAAEAARMNNPHAPQSQQ